MKCLLAISMAWLISATTYYTLPVSQTQSENGGGTVKGNVVDAANHLPVNGATVFAFSAGPSIGIVPQAVTDRDGRFVLFHVAPGRTLIVASKPEAGYPDASFAQLANENLQTSDVSVHADQTTDCGTLTIRKGTVITGIVVDAQKGTALPGATIWISKLGAADRSLKTSADTKGRFRFVLPAVPLEMRISAPGYRTWENSDKFLGNSVGLGTSHELRVSLESLPEKPQ